MVYIRMFTNLLLVPFEIWKQDETVLWVWIFKHDPIGLRFLFQDVVNPLEEKTIHCLYYLQHYKNHSTWRIFKKNAPPRPNHKHEPTSIRSRYSTAKTHPSVLIFHNNTKQKQKADGHVQVLNVSISSIKRTRCESEIIWDLVEAEDSRFDLNLMEEM